MYLDNNANKFCKKLYFGKHLSRYCLKDTEKWINYQPEEMIIIENERKNGKRPGLWMRDEKIFNREKILSRFVAKEIIAAYDNENKYYEHTLHSTHVIDQRFKIKFVLALFNSTLFKFYYQNTNSKGGNIFPQVRISSIESLPIKYANNLLQNEIEALVNEIIILKNADKTADITIQSNNIDQLIYEI